MICQNETMNLLSNNSENKTDDVLDGSIIETKTDSEKKVLTDTTTVSGIYKIINRVNGKYYVGSSEDICGKRGRWWKHKRLLRTDNHPNDYLQKAWNKHNEQNFNFVVVEPCGQSELLTTEQKYLDVAKLEKHLTYNLSFIAGRVEMTIEVCQKISEANKRRIWTKETRQRISTNNTKEKHPLWGKRFSKKKCNAGCDNPMFDNDVYEFTNGTETFCGHRTEFITRFENRKSAEVAVSLMIKGKKSSHLGWKLLQK